MKEKRRRLEFLSLLRILLKNDFLTCIISVLKKIFDSIIYSISIIVLARCINSVIQIAQKEMKILNFVIWIVLGMLIAGYRYISEDIDKLFYTILSNKLKIKAGTEFLEKIANVSCEDVENKNLWNGISRYKDSPEKVITNIYIKFITLVSSLLEFVIILGIVFKRNRSLTIIELALMLVVFFLIIFISKILNISEVKSDDYIEAARLNSILKSDEILHDREIFSYKKLVNEKIEKILKKINKLEFRIDLKKNIIFKIGNIGAFICGLVSMIQLLPLVIENKISIGFFIALNLILIINVREIAKNVFKTSSKSKVLKEILKYYELIMNLSEKKDGQPINIDYIEFKNVFYKDPEQKTYILKNTCFLLEKGKVYSFVGKNEATVIFKLLTGIYDEYEGDILINGTNVKEFCKDDLINSLSIFLNKFNIYPISVKENLNLGSIEEASDLMLSRVLNKLNLYDYLISLPKGINTFLDDIKIDEEISRRFIMARLSLSKTDLKIVEDFSEVGERKNTICIYKNFNELNKDKIVIYVSESNILEDIVDLVIDINEKCANKA